MINDDTVRAANIREIMYRGGEECQLRQIDAIYELAGKMIDPSDKFEINYFDLDPIQTIPPLPHPINKQLLVKVYKDRKDCPVWGIGRDNGEQDYVIQCIDNNLIVTCQKYLRYVVRGRSNRQRYWVRVPY